MWDLIGGVLDFVGGLETNETNKDIASGNNQFNAEQASLNRDFQREMSNTAYQRATYDMKQAGLNPMLAYSQGGASTPSGGAATAAPAIPMKNPVSSAVATAQMALQMDNIREQNDLLKAQAEKTRAETATERDMRYKLLGAQTSETLTRVGTGEHQQRVYANTAENLAQQTQNLKVDYERIMHQTELLKRQAKTEEERAIVTQLQQGLTIAETQYKKGQIGLQTYEKIIMEAEGMIRNSGVQGAAEESKFQSNAGQLQRWLKTLNPLSGLMK